MTSLTRNEVTINPTIALLASAMRLQYATEPAAVRAIDRALGNLATELPYDFDGVELRITSFSRRAAGVEHVTDGIGCTCESGKRPWCWHRVACRLMLADWAMTQPNVLRAKIVEQVSPLDLDQDDAGYDSYGDFLDQPYRPTYEHVATPPPVRARVDYDPKTREFAVFENNAPVAFCRSYLEGEGIIAKRRQAAYEAITGAANDALFS